MKPMLSTCILYDKLFSLLPVSLAFIGPALHSFRFVSLAAHTRFERPTGVSIAPDGATLYVCDADRRVVAFAADGLAFRGAVETIEHSSSVGAMFQADGDAAGTAVTGSKGRSSHASAMAMTMAPRALAFDAARRLLFVADAAGNRVLVLRAF